MKFRSRSQQRWAFANKMKWALRSAHETGERGGTKSSRRRFASLPNKIRHARKKK